MTYLLPLLGLASFVNGLVLWWLARRLNRETVRLSASSLEAAEALRDEASRCMQLAAEHWDNAATAAIVSARAKAEVVDICASEMKRAARERAA